MILWFSGFYVGKDPYVTWVRKQYNIGDLLENEDTALELIEVYL